MKYLPAATLLLWIGVVVGWIYAREFFLQPLVKFPLFIVLAILLPVCFWVLTSEKRRVFASLFLGLFIVNTSVLTYGAVKNYSLLNTFDPLENLRLDPKLVELTVVGEDEEMRHFTATIIYEKHGIQLPFKKEDGRFALYIPDDASESAYLDYSAENAGLKYVKPNIKYQTDAILFLLAIQLAVFILIISLLLLLGERENLQK